MSRWLRFSAVGMLGVAVQLAVLQMLVKLGLQYLFATALAVEAALLHNYVWHCRWTWGTAGRVPHRLLRFHVANGLISLASNLLWMRVLTGWLNMPPVIANLIAITATALLNFLMADRWVFAQDNDGSTRH